MDYQRVYDDFIESRKQGPVITGYCEHHHIAPRSVGGTDDPSNIIALTASDHLFAHVLLHKIHGGKMTAALWLMLNGNSYKNSGRKLVVNKFKRKHYESTRLAWQAINKRAKKLTGADHGNFNPQEYTWEHVHTGEIKAATVWGMDQIHPNGNWSKVLRGEAAHSYGWAIHGSAKLKPKSLVSNRWGKCDISQTWLFGGDEVTASVRELASITGAHQTGFNSVVNGKTLSYKGYSLANPVRAPKVIGKAQMKPVRCIETGEVFDSLKSAKESLGIYGGSGSFHRALNEPHRVAHGFHWEYVQSASPS